MGLFDSYESILYISDSQLKDSVSELDCSQFIDDYDIIRQFPFPVLINPSEYTFEQSIVVMNKNNTFVQEIYIIEEEVVPSSVFCLSNLQMLSILETPFQDGNLYSCEQRVFVQ
jgi:hypothetical protein